MSAAGPVLVTITSACGVTGVVIVVEWWVALSPCGSGVVLVTVAVLLRLAATTLLATATTNWKVAVEPLVRVALLSLMLVAVLVSVKAGPLVSVFDTKVSPPGRLFFPYTTLFRSGPVFWTVMV